MPGGACGALTGCLFFRLDVESRIYGIMPLNRKAINNTMRQRYLSAIPGVIRIAVLNTESGEEQPDFLNLSKISTDLCLKSKEFDY